MDRFRMFLARWIVSPMQGVTLATWFRLLADNRFRVGLRFWPRAVLTTLSAGTNSVQGRRESRRYDRAVAETEALAPLFILGHYRTGTTHLHNLVAQDERFAFINSYQATQPHTFLTAGDLGARLGSPWVMRRRPQDNVALDLRVPAEDELALAVDTLLSPHLGWHFPARAHYYEDRYLTFAAASDDERQRWVASLRRLAGKLTLKYGRAIVFKSPLHTARVPLLLRAFPGARFAHLHRDPYLVFRSTLHMERTVEPLFRFQSGDEATLEDRVLTRYRRMYEAYLSDRTAVPPGRLVEIAYDDLDQDPLGTLAAMYEKLGLPTFAAAEPNITRYLESISGYEKNVYPALDPGLADRVRAQWGFTFDAFGYPR